MAVLSDRLPRRVSLFTAIGGTTLFAGIALSVLPAWAAATRGYSEYEVKAAILSKFAKFIEWPDEDKRPKDEPWRVGVLGKDPFGQTLEEALDEETVRGREFEVHRADQAHELKDCHIVFICASEREEMSTILDYFNGRNVLTIGDTDQMAEQGAVINLRMAGRKVRFEINPEAAKRAKLKISSQLLKLARIVEDESAKEAKPTREEG